MQEQKQEKRNCVQLYFSLFIGIVYCCRLVVVWFNLVPRRIIVATMYAIIVVRHLKVKHTEFILNINSFCCLLIEKNGEKNAKQAEQIENNKNKNESTIEKPHIYNKTYCWQSNLYTFSIWKMLMKSETLFFKYWTCYINCTPCKCRWGALNVLNIEPIFEQIMFTLNLRQYFCHEVRIWKENDEYNCSAHETMFTIIGISIQQQQYPRNKLRWLMRDQRKPRSAILYSLAYEEKNPIGNWIIQNRWN